MKLMNICNFFVYLYLDDKCVLKIYINIYRDLWRRNTHHRLGTWWIWRNPSAMFISGQYLRHNDKYWSIRTKRINLTCLHLSVYRLYSFLLWSLSLNFDMAVPLCIWPVIVDHLVKGQKYMVGVKFVYKCVLSFSYTVLPR